MKRRQFLRMAAIGSGSFVAVPTLVNALTTAARADDDDDHDDGQTNFHFVVQSQAPPIGAVVPRINISGAGMLTPSRVVGGGSFHIFNNASPIPRTLLALGTWKAKRLVSFNPIGTYGVVTAGILVAKIRLVPDFPPSGVVPAVLKVVCNAGAGGLSTGEPEGIVLTIPEWGFGTFVPLHPEIGITVFNPGNERED